MTPIYHIQLLGGFRLFVDNQPLTTFNKPRQQALLAYLLLHRHLPQARQQIAFTFWPDSSESQAYTNLRKLFFDLRQALPAADHFLAADGLSLSWRNDAPFTLDVAEVERALEQIEKGATPTPQMVEPVVAHYGGELLPTCYDEWLLPMRRALHERVVTSLTQALVQLEAQHEVQVGLRTAEHLLRLDPLHEATYRHLMHLRALSGDRAGALRIYHECVTMIEQELGVSPSTETQALYQQVLKTEPQAAFAPTSAPTPEAVERHKRIPLVGRKQKWQLLQQAWQQMPNRGPQMVTVWGEAGVGKTRLVEELLQWAKLRPGTVAYARAYAAEGALAYAPLTEWLRSEPFHAVLERVEPLWLSELARLLPELLTQNPKLPPPLPMTESWQRQRFHEALARAVVAAPQPQLLVLDDLQWCDVEMLAWLRYLLHFDPKASLLVVGTVRSEAVDAQHALDDLRQQLRREGQWGELEVPALSAEETLVLAGHLTPEDVTPLKRQLYQETEGNPLFVVEMVRAGLLKSKSDEEAAPGQALPATIQAVISTRLGQLSSPAQQLLQLSATIGRAFSVDVLGRASEFDEETLVRALDELWQRRLVREQGVGYDFSHDKIREVAYQQVSRLRRRLLHRRVAVALESVHRRALEPISGQIAAHWEAAEEPGRAVHYFQRAAIYSAARLANGDAIHYFGRALRYVPEDDHELRYELLLARLKLLTRQGRREEERADLALLLEVVKHFAASLETSRRQGEVAMCTARYWNGLDARAETKAAAQEAAQLAEEAHDAGLAAEAYVMWGWVEFLDRANYKQAQPLWERALHLAKAAELPRTEAETLANLTILRLYSGSPLQLIEMQARQALALYQTCGDRTGEAIVLGRLAYIIFTQGEGRYLEAIGYCQSAMSFSVETIGWDAARFAIGTQGYLYYLLGDAQQALSDMAQELSITRQAESPATAAGSLWGLGSLYLDLGDYTQAKAALEEALHLLQDDHQYQVKVLGLLALLHAALEEFSQARAYGERAVALAEIVGDPRLKGTALIRLGRVLVGEGARARTLFQQALLLHREMEQFGQALKALAGLAEVELQEMQVRQALEYVDEILEELPSCQLDATDEVLHIYLTCYRVLSASGDPRAAQALALAQSQVERRAATIPTDLMKQCFWAVPAHRAVLEAGQQTPTQGR